MPYTGSEPSPLQSLIMPPEKVLLIDVFTVIEEVQSSSSELTCVQLFNGAPFLSIANIPENINRVIIDKSTTMQMVRGLPSHINEVVVTGNVEPVVLRHMRSIKKVFFLESSAFNYDSVLEYPEQVAEVIVPDEAFAKLSESSEAQELPKKIISHSSYLQLDMGSKSYLKTYQTSDDAIARSDEGAIKEYHEYRRKRRGSSEDEVSSVTLLRLSPESDLSASLNSHGVFRTSPTNMYLTNADMKRVRVDEIEMPNGKCSFGNF